MFVGRDDELRVLTGALDALGAGRGSFFAIVGEPGIGKTRLADELVARANERGAIVAWGSAWDGGGAPAYWPWIQVVRSLRAHVPEPDERLRRELGPLWDEGAMDNAHDDGTRDHELLRFRRFDALRTVLAVASSRAPVVVVLDDVHAADRASLLALHFVARGVRSLRALVIATHRDAEPRMDASVGELLSRVAREGRTIALRRLTRDHVARWMDALDGVPPRLVDEVHQRSGGNPLFVDETLRVVRAGGHAEDVPDGVSAVIRERLARFDARARETLDAAAVLGREVSWSVLAQVCGTTVAEVRDRLRAPMLADVVDDVRGERVSFAHALFREGLYRELDVAERARLHVAAGHTFVRQRELGRDVADETIALHLLAALPAGDASDAVTWALRAGERAMRELAFDRAVVMLEGARAALDRIPADATRTIDVELSLAEALTRVGSLDRARAMCLAAAARARGLDDGPRLARAALAYGAELRISVVDAQLVALLEESLATLPASERALRARVMARLAAAQQPSTTPGRPMALAREAIALARSIGDPTTMVETLYTAGSALVDYARPEERLPLARELVALAIPRGDLSRAQQGYARAAIDCVELCDLGGADLAIEAHARLGDALGHPRWRWRSVLMRAMRCSMQGRFAETEAAHDEVLTVAPQADDPNVGPTLALSRIGLLRTRQSGTAADLTRAWHPALESLEHAELLGPLVRASVFARWNDRAAVRGEIATLPIAHALYESDPIALMLAAESAACARDVPRATAVIGALRANVSRVLTWGVFGLAFEGPVAQWLGAIASLIGEHDEAVAAWDDALALVEDLDVRPHVARMSVELASALVARGGAGDVERARALRDTAGGVARELGMSALERRIEADRSSDVPRAVQAAVAVAPSIDGVDPATTFELRREGDVWIVEHGGRSTFVKHSRGVEILDELVRNPGREVHVLDLGGAAEPGQAIDVGDSGETLDATAKAAYRRRIAELREELVEAEQWSDTGRRDRLRAELELLADELARGVGLGGRERRSGAAVERARVNVQKRLRGVVRKIAEGLPDLGRHLEQAIETGTFVSYSPRRS